jgi:predicted pyridoxine 5'-phosphate oxidase superfamily flavin-nucleotide-binding protein
MTIINSSTNRGYPSDVAFSSAVKAIQSEKGSRTGYAKMEQSRGWNTTITPDLARVISELDMFYLGTASAAGQPYIQHRGGPAGFLKVLDEKTLGFADFGGNRQYISVGNLSENSQAIIFLMDYVNLLRIKVWGRARVVEGAPDLLERLSDPQYSGKVERAILFEVEAWDMNCSQHIHRRYSEQEFAPVVEQLKSKIASLENELQQLRAAQKIAN